MQLCTFLSIPKKLDRHETFWDKKDLSQLTNRAIWIMKANTEATTLRQSRPYIASLHSNMSILDRTDNLVKASINKGSVVK